MKRETSNGNAYLANCPIPADSIIILIFYTFIRQPWFKRLIFLSHIERTFHFKSRMFKVVLPWCCNGRKRQMREILAAWFCLCTAVRSRRLEILLWDLENLSSGRTNSCKQHLSEGPPTFQLRAWKSLSGLWKSQSTFQISSNHTLFGVWADSQSVGRVQK